MKKLNILFLLLPFLALAQKDDLLKEIDSTSLAVDYEIAAFKGLKIVNFESTKMVSKNQLYFVVSHRFGTIKTGIEDFFGLEQAVTRLNFIYGITDGINLGVSRSSFKKTYETSLKLRLLRQKDGGSPFTIVLFNSILLNTILEKEVLPGLEFKHKLGYSTQVLVSKKLSPDLSLQIVPTYFHDNLAVIDEQDNSQYAIGIGLLTLPQLE